MSVLGKTPDVISQKFIREYVIEKIAFKSTNVFGHWINDMTYVVYSYGIHFPIYAWVNGVWYRNEEKYSSTTTKHQTLADPEVDDIVEVSTEGLQWVINNPWR